MKCIIIGLGNYGSVLAEELTLLGHEVIGVDSDETKVELVKDKIATSFIIDATDELSLSILPLRAVDIVIVAIGENFGASVRVVALLKKFKVQHIYARSIDNLQKTVLEAFNLDSILFPEKDAARSLVQLLDLKVNVESFKVDDEHYVVKFKIPTPFIGYNVNKLEIEKEFNLKIISLVKATRTVNSLGISIFEKGVSNTFEDDYALEEEDQLVCYGKYKDFMAFWKAV